MPKAISCWQPWAQMNVRGRRVELRCWYTHYRGPLVIHAGLKTDKRFGLTIPKDKLGVLVGMVRVVDCKHIANEKEWRKVMKGFGEYKRRPYGKKTHVWFLADHEEFPNPIPWRGIQGFFNVPDAVIRRARRRLARRPGRTRQNRGSLEAACRKKKAQRSG